MRYLFRICLIHGERGFNDASTNAERLWQRTQRLYAQHKYAIHHFKGFIVERPDDDCLECFIAIPDALNERFAAMETANNELEAMARELVQDIIAHFASKPPGDAPPDIRNN